MIVYWNKFCYNRVTVFIKICYISLIFDSNFAAFDLV